MTRRRPAEELRSGGRGLEDSQKEVVGLLGGREGGNGLDGVVRKDGWTRRGAESEGGPGLREQKTSLKATCSAGRSWGRN